MIRTADQLHTLREGEVLVCPTTSAAWTMVFRRAGAIVADTGSALSQTAIVASCDRAAQASCAVGF